MPSTIVILGTGGTIAGTADSASDNVGYTAAQRSVHQLLQSAPGLAGQALEAAGRRVARVVPEFAPGPTGSGQPELCALGTPEEAYVVLTGHGAEQGVAVLPLTPMALTLARTGLPAAEAGDDQALVVRAEPAVAALAERLPRVVPTILEFACMELALQALEQQLAQAWPQLEEDGPLAFDFDHRSDRRRDQLGSRFRGVLGIRARWSQLQPPLHRPLVYPPTLASQLGERLRERARLAERWETLGGQIDVFQNVYELCAQRAHDWRLAWKGHTLEVLIILLLLLQTVLLMFELFASRET